MCACGDDHTVALSHDRCSVFTFGRGEHGQLGHARKMFVNAPARSTALSADHSSPLDGVLAKGNCSATVRDGALVSTAGSCAKVLSELRAAAAAVNY